MKKIVYILVLILVSFGLKAQTLPSGAPSPNSPTGYSLVGYVRSGKAFVWTKTDTTFTATYPSVVWSPDGNFYKTDGGSGSHWSLWIPATPTLGTVTSVATNNGTGITGGTITSTGTLANDTTLLSTRLWRQKGIDSLIGLINLKLNISDTTAMLSNLLRKTDTATMLNGYARSGNVVPNIRTINTNAPLTGGGNLGSDLTLVADTGRSNAQLVSGGSLNKVRDSLQANITASVAGVSSVSTTDNYGISSSVANPTTTPNISIGVDTSLIIPYTDTLKVNGIATKTDIINAATGGTVTSIATTNGILGGTITTTGTLQVDSSVYSTKANVTALLLAKLNLSDTSTMLNPYLRKTDTSTMLLPYLRKTDTANMLTGYTRVQRFLDTTSTLRALINTKGTGTVTSVALSLPSFITVSGSPITTSGTLTGTLANQTANTFFRGPTSGSPAQPVFGAITAADIPDLSGTYIKNQTTEQSSSNFNISGTGVMAVSMGVGTTSSPVSSQQINTSSPISTLSNSTTTVMQNLLLGALNFYSNDNSVTSTGGVGAIMVKSASDYNSSFTPSYMTFSIHDTSANNSTVLGTITEVMRLNESKKVLILDSVDNRRDVLQVNGNAQFTSLTPTVTLSYNSSTISANDLIASFNAYSKDASITSSGGVGGLRVYAEQDFNSGNTPSYVTVSTHANTPNDSTQPGNVLERLRINADGTYKFTSYPTAGFVKTSSDGTVSIDAGSYITPTDTAAMLSHYAYKDLTNTSFYDSIAALRSLANSKYTGGTVTSIDMSVPIGLSISGNPITTSGTLAVSLTSGYQIPTTNNPSFTGTAASLNIGGTAATATALVNSVTFNNGGSGDASGTTFDGSAARIISYNSVGASPLAGSSSLVTTGALTSGSIGSGFGSINIGSNSLTAGAISGTTGAFSSQILSTVGNNSRYLYNGTATTGYIYQQLGNTGGNMLLGLDASTGGALATGAPAYSTVLTTATATALAFGINQVIKYTIDASGNNTWTGSGEFGSTLTASSLQTDAPSGSTARLWKLGDYTGGAAVQTGYISVDINGTVYYLLAVLPTEPQPKPTASNILNKKPFKLDVTKPKKP